MVTSANSALPTPIKVIRSTETQEQVDTTPIEVTMERKGYTDGKAMVRFAILHSARRTLPYGMWTTFDGRQVLFNREYQPILEKKDRQCAHCDRDEWVNHTQIESVRYFYDDLTAPMRYMVKHLGGEALTAKEAKACKKALLVCMQFLKDFTPEESSSVSSRYSVAR